MPTIDLDYGYMDLEQVEAEVKRDSKNLQVASSIREDESGRVYVELSSDLRIDLVKFTRRFLGETLVSGTGLAESMVSELIRIWQDKHEGTGAAGVTRPPSWPLSHPKET